MEEEYERRHSPIWPELEEVLKNHGVINYSIFLHTESNQLFAYAEIEDEACWNSIAEPPICQKWWAHMKDLLAKNPDNSPVSQELHEVFQIG